MSGSSVTAVPEIRALRTTKESRRDDPFQQLSARRPDAAQPRGDGPDDAGQGRRRWSGNAVDVDVLRPASDGWADRDRGRAAELDRTVQSGYAGTAHR